MKTLGIDISGTNLRWIVIKGTKSKGSLSYLTPNKLTFPTAGEDFLRNLIELKRMVSAKLASEKIELVGVIKSTHGCSVERAKCELIVELACLETGVRCVLIDPRTVAAALKPTGILKKLGGSFQDLFNAGQALDPAYLEGAAVCAWSAMT